MRAIYPVVGGNVDPADVIGRDRELDELLRACASNGAVLLGDRRFGKTSILRKAAPLLEQAGHRVISLSAETTDIASFVKLLNEALRKQSWLSKELARWEVSIDLRVAGVGLTLSRGGSSTTHDFFEWAAERAKPHRLVVMVDEVSVLLQRLSDQPAERDEFMHSLRRARQNIDNLSIVLAGSVGLHHVVGDSSTVNDLAKIRVGPLDPCDALFLARCNIAGTELLTDDERALAEEVVIASDGVPFYVQSLVDRMRLYIPGPEGVDDLVTALIEGADDPWDLKWYRDRIADYFGGDAELAAMVLDVYALHGPLTLSALANQLGLAGIDPLPSRARLIAVVERLALDHYVERSTEGERFAQSILRRAWIHLRRLND